MSCSDYLTALEDFDNFLSSPIVEYKDSKHEYPIGKSLHKGEMIHFMHYKNFEQALQKWNERAARIDKTNMAIMYTSWAGVNGGGTIEELERFDQLPFKNKVVFTDKPYPNIKSSFWLKGLGCENQKNKQVYATQSFLTGKRYIDQFDYIDFFNKIKNDDK